MLRVYDMEEELEYIASRVRKARKSVEKKYSKALPSITRINAPFFGGLKRHELLLQRCDHCGLFQWYPKVACNECMSKNLVWTKCSGKGTVYSFTIIRQIVGNPSWTADVPYVVALVDLDEGVRLEASITDCKPEGVHVGMAVSATFEDATEEISLLKFRPCGF